MLPFCTRYKFPFITTRISPMPLPFIGPRRMPRPRVSARSGSQGVSLALPASLARIPRARFRPREKLAGLLRLARRTWLDLASSASGILRKAIIHTAPQSQKAVTAHLKSKQLPPFGFARQHSNPLPDVRQKAVAAVLENNQLLLFDCYTTHKASRYYI